MQVQINAADPHTRSVDDDMVRMEVQKAMERFGRRVTRVEVHVKDQNGPKSGDDKHCTMEVRLAGLDPLAVTAEAEDFRAAVTSAAGKLQRLVQHTIEKQRER